MADTQSLDDHLLQTERPCPLLTLPNELQLLIWEQVLLLRDPKPRFAEIPIPQRIDKMLTCRRNGQGKNDALNTNVAEPDLLRVSSPIRRAALPVYIKRLKRGIAQIEEEISYRETLVKGTSIRLCLESMEMICKLLVGVARLQRAKERVEKEIEKTRAREQAQSVALSESGQPDMEDKAFDL